MHSVINQRTVAVSSRSQKKSYDRTFKLPFLFPLLVLFIILLVLVLFLLLLLLLLLLFILLLLLLLLFLLLSRLLGCGLIWLHRRHNAVIGEIVNKPPHSSSSAERRVGVVCYHINPPISTHNTGSGHAPCHAPLSTSPTISIQIAVDLHSP